MQPDLTKAGIVSYGFGRLPTYGQVQCEPARKTRIMRTASHHPAEADLRAYTLEFSLVGTAAAFFVCASYSTRTAIHTAIAPIRNSVSFNLDAPSISTSRQETSSGGDEQVRNGILEMRPARGSLQDKAQEEMSEFEREYPW